MTNPKPIGRQRSTMRSASCACSAKSHECGPHEWPSFASSRCLSTRSCATPISRAHTFLTSNLGFLATPSSILTSTIFVDLYHSSYYVLPIYIRVAGIVVVVDGDMGW